MPNVNDPATAPSNFKAIQTYINQPWTDYKVALTASITNPDIGPTGTALGRYRQFGKLVIVRIDIRADEDSTNGSGNYGVSLPFFTCKTTTRDFNQYLSVFYVESGGNIYTGTALIDSPSNVLSPIYIDNGPPMSILSDSNGGLGAGAVISIFGAYECQ